MKALTASAVSKIIHANQVSKKRDGTGHFIFRKSYFYRHGNDQHQFADRIAKEGKASGLNVTIIDKGDHWASFNGGASLAKSSHFWVVAEITRA